MWFINESFNWALMLAYAVILIIGIVVGAFVIAFYGPVGYIDRFEPVLADYSAEFSIGISPLSVAVIDASQLSYLVENPYREDDFVFISLTPTPQATIVPTSSPTETPEIPETATSTLTPSSTPSASSTPTATFTLFPTEGIFTATPKITTPPEPRPTIPQPPPSATPQPTEPPRPSRTPNPYPPYP